MAADAGHGPRDPALRSGPGIDVPEAMDGARCVDVAWARLGCVARRAIGPLIGDGGLTVDGRCASIAQPLRAGQRLAVTDDALRALAETRRTTPPSPLPVAVVHEDADVLVVDKPAGMHVHPMGPHRGDTLLGVVLWHAGARPGDPWTDYRPSPAHRLDRPTSGLVLFAKSIAVRDVLQGLMDRHEVERTYTARVHGGPVGEDGVIDLPLGRDPTDPRRQAVVGVTDGGRRSRSRWRVLHRAGTTTTLQLQLETGRTHQLRAHLAHLGHPILGDTLYGAPATGAPPDPRTGDTIALRAVGLSFAHPRDQRILSLRVAR